MPYYYSPLRKEYISKGVNDAEKPKECVFCNDQLMHTQALRNKSGVVFENDHYVWLVNWFPRTEAHTMLVPKRHVTLIAEETDEELKARQALLLIAMNALEKTFGETGFEVFLQTGKGSLSSVKHLHWHVVPTIVQDTTTISFAKFGYFYTTEPAEEKIVTQPIEITMARDVLIKAISEHT